MRPLKKNYAVVDVKCQLNWGLDKTLLDETSGYMQSEGIFEWNASIKKTFIFFCYVPFIQNSVFDVVQYVVWSSREWVMKVKCSLKPVSYLCLQRSGTRQRAFSCLCAQKILISRDSVKVIVNCWNNFSLCNSWMIKIDITYSNTSFIQFFWGHK